MTAQTAATTAVVKASSTAARDAPSCCSSHRSSTRSSFESPASGEPEQSARAQQPVESLDADPGEEHPDVAERRRTPPSDRVVRAAGEVQGAAQAEQCGVPGSGVIGEEAQQEGIGVAVEEHRSVDQVFEGSLKARALEHRRRCRRTEDLRTVAHPTRDCGDDLAQGSGCRFARLRDQADQPARSAPDVSVLHRGHDDVMDLAPPEVSHQDTGRSCAEADTGHVSRRAGHVQIGGPTAAAGDLVDSAVDDEAVRPELLHRSRDRGLAQARQVDELVPSQGRSRKDHFEDRRLVVVARRGVADHSHDRPRFDPPAAVGPAPASGPAGPRSCATTSARATAMARSTLTQSSLAWARR